jgi:hypothetical protein
MKKILPVIAIFGSVFLTASACFEDPCSKMAAPSPTEIQVSQSGAEVERELENGVECELTWSNTGATRWERESGE